MLTREKLSGAVCRGWCHSLNKHKPMDSDLVAAIVNELAALLSAGGARVLQTGAPRSAMRYAVFSGAEKFDYGDKSVSALCQSEEQAKHMATFCAGSGYYEPLQTGAAK